MPHTSSWIKHATIGPAFRRYWLSHVLSQVGGQFGGLAIPLIAITLLNADNGEIGLLVAVRMLPWLLFGLISGPIVDRYDRRMILICSDGVRGLLMLVIPVSYWLGVMNIEILFTVTFLVGTLTVFFETANQSFLPSILDESRLIEANGKLGASESISGTLGPTSAGFAIQVFGSVSAAAVNAATFILSTFCIWSIKSVEPAYPRGERGSILAELRSGLVYVLGHSIIRSFTMSNALFMLFFTVLQSVFIVYLSRNLGLDAGEIGISLGIANFGAILGAGLSHRMGGMIGASRSIVVGAVFRATGPAMFLVAIAVPNIGLPAILIGQFIQQLGWSIWAVHQSSVRQAIVPNEFRGRANGTFLFVVRSFTSLGGFLGAFIAAAVGIVPTVAIGVVGGVLSILLLNPRRLAKIEVFINDS